MFAAMFGSVLTVGNGVDASAVLDVAADSAGNSYVAGVFRGVVDFDLATVRADGTDILAPRGAADAFVAKYAPDDSLVWVRSMGGDSVNSEYARRLAVDASGAVYVAGEFLESADFGTTTLMSAGGADGFVTKLDAAGNFLWARQWGNAAYDSARAIDVDALGNVYVLGGQASGQYDIKKFSPIGGSNWSRQIPTRSPIANSDLAVNADGQVFVVGSFVGTVDFDPSVKAKYVSSGAGRGAFALKLDTNGKFKWVSAFLGESGSSQNSAAATSIALDDGGNVVVGGYFLGTVDFNPGNPTAYLTTHSGGFITKLNSQGGLAWASPLLADATTFVYGLNTDASGGIYATGTYAGTVDFDPGVGVFSRTSVGSHDMFVLKLSSAGTFVWTETFGASSDDVSFGIAISTNGDVLTGGYYREPFDINSDPLVTQLLPGGTGSRGLRLRLRQY
ncbi:MAG: hypothetical protein U0795_10825 [Pirellulales bacterium]